MPCFILTHPHSQHCVSLCVCFVRLLAFFYFPFYFVFEFSTVEIGVLFCYTCTCTCIKVAFHFISRFKDLKCLSKPDRAEVWGTVRALLQEMERPVQPDNRVTPEPPTKKPTLMLAHETSSSEEEDSIEQCLERYKAEPLAGMDDCPQEWWSTHEGAHSEMSRLARKYLATPASSVPSERLFSLSGHIVQKKRASLLSENVNRLVCLSNWLKAKK